MNRVRGPNGRFLKSTKLSSKESPDPEDNFPKIQEKKIMKKRKKKTKIKEEYIHENEEPNQFKS